MVVNKPLFYCLFILMLGITIASCSAPTARPSAPAPTGIPAPSTTTGTATPAPNHRPTALTVPTAQSSGATRAGAIPDAWQQAGCLLPTTVQLLQPTWLPDPFQAAMAELQAAHHLTDTGPFYYVRYQADRTRNLELTLGRSPQDAPDLDETAFDRREAIVVRHTSGQLFSAATHLAVRWTEHNQVYTVQVHDPAPSRDTLLRVVAQLASTPGCARLPADVWAQVRCAMPADVPVYRPGWLPERFGAPALLEARVSADLGPLYTITYPAPDESMVFILNLGKGALGNVPPPDQTEPITVLGVEGTLQVSTATHTLSVEWAAHDRRGKPMLGYQIRVFSQVMTRDELMQIVQSLAPVEPSPVTPRP
jgi:hypothetical protein